LPNDLPPWHVVYQQMRRWIDAHCFETLVEDLHGLLREYAGHKAQQLTQVLDHGFKTTGLDPAPHLLIDHRPRRKIVGQHAPVTAGLGYITQRVEDAPQGILALLGVFAAKSSIGSHKSPLLVGHIRRIAQSVSIAHASIVAAGRCRGLSQCIQRPKINNSF